MFKKLLKSMAIPLRKAIGVELILQNQRQIIERVSIEHSSRLIYQCLDILNLFKPMDIEGAKFVRLGRDFDGGYIVVEELLRSASAAYSFGIGYDCSFEAALSGYGLKVYMHDHTVQVVELPNDLCQFFRVGVTGCKFRENCQTLSDIMCERGHDGKSDILLKLDVEGCEWDVLEECSEKTLNFCSQIIVEFHGIEPWMSQSSLDALRKLNSTHQCVHVHGNRSLHPDTIPVVVGGVILPRLIEATYVRKMDFVGRLRPNTRQFPTALDMPNLRELADVELMFGRR